MSGCRIGPVPLGLSLGVLWGVSVLVVGLIATYFSYGRPFVEALGVMYLGYQPSVWGSILGGVFGFIDAFLGGLVIAWLYNCFNRGCGKCCSKEEQK